VDSVYRFLLMLRNGEAADPPAFLTEQADWKPGDEFVAANGRAFRIVDTDAEVEAARVRRSRSTSSSTASSIRGVGSSRKALSSRDSGLLVNIGPLCSDL
jgi:hypothetical protein